jgi:hypothetical protein
MRELGQRGVYRGQIQQSPLSVRVGLHECRSSFVDDVSR